MFWNNIATDERDIDIKLNSEEPDFISIIEDIHCVQEIRNSNEKLLTYLKQEDNFRRLFSIIFTPVDDGEIDRIEPAKSQYRLISQCCDALCIGAREFYPEFEKHPDLFAIITEFLNDGSRHINPLIASFYSRIVICFLSIEPEKFLNILEGSNFLDNCMNALEHCSVFELLCTMMNCTPDPSFRERMKKWYVDKGFAQKLLTLLSPEYPSFVHENVASLWVEFIKAFREFQYNFEQSADPLLDSIQSEEIVTNLLSLMFPVEDELSSSIISNGALVLNALLETNPIQNSPSSILAQQIQGTNGNNNSISVLDDLQDSSYSCSDNTVSSKSHLLMDPKRVVETRCAEHAANIISLILHGLDPIRIPQISIRQSESIRVVASPILRNSKPLVDYSSNSVDEHQCGNDVNNETSLDLRLATTFEASDQQCAAAYDEFSGEIVNNCMQLLINLTNTNFLPTHFELLKAFSFPESSFHLLCELVEEDPCRSIFNAQFIAFISHILYSNTGSTQRPLVDFLIKDFNFPAFILRALPDHENDVASPTDKDAHFTNKMQYLARRSFFFNLADRLLQSQQSSPNAEYIEELIKGSSVSDQWSAFCVESVQSFIDQNRSEKVNSISISTRTSNAIEVDELPDGNVLTLPVANSDVQNLRTDFQDLKLMDPIFPNGGTTSTSSFSPKTMTFSSALTSPINRNSPTIPQQNASEVKDEVEYGEACNKKAEETNSEMTLLSFESLNIDEKERQQLPLKEFDLIVPNENE